MLDQDQYWMEQALLQAKCAYANHEVPIGAIIIANNTVIGIGANAPIANCDPTAHAEIIAIRDAAQRINNYRLSNATLYSTIEPCAMCVGAMIHARITRLVFGAFEPKTGAVSSAFQLLDGCRHNHTIEYHGGVLHDRAQQLLQSFFSKRRGKHPA